MMTCECTFVENYFKSRNNVDHLWTFKLDGVWSYCLSGNFFYRKSTVILVSQIFCKFFVLPFRQKNSQLSDYTDYTDKTRQNSYFGVKMGQEQLNFLHWLLKNYLFFLMFRNLGKMLNKYYSFTCQKFQKFWETSTTNNRNTIVDIEANNDTYLLQNE